MTVTRTLKTIMKPVSYARNFLRINGMNAMVTGLLFVPRLAVVARHVRTATAPSLSSTVPHPTNPSIASETSEPPIMMCGLGLASTSFPHHTTFKRTTAAYYR